MTNDAITSGIGAICSPTPECRQLRDRIIEEVESRFDALDAAAAALRWVGENYPAAMREMPTPLFRELRKADRV